MQEKSWACGKLKDDCYCLVTDGQDWKIGYFERGNFDVRYETADVDDAVSYFVDWVRKEEVRGEWEAFWREVDQTYQDAKDSQGALLALFDRYRNLRPDERKAVDDLLADKLESPSENVRFDVLALVGEFNIRSTEPQLRSLAARLEADMTPGAPFELAKVNRTLKQFQQSS